jgi:hypothetical protein
MKDVVLLAASFLMKDVAHCPGGNEDQPGEEATA